MNPTVAVKIVDLALMAIGITPELIDKVMELRRKLIDGEEIDMEELDALVERIKDRSRSIQDA